MLYFPPSPRGQPAVHNGLAEVECIVLNYLMKISKSYQESERTYNEVTKYMYMTKIENNCKTNMIK